MNSVEQASWALELAKGDYSNPGLICDLVMKGGVTGGIVYPLAVCELAQTYRFKNVGGTSAGAIAAAAAAAAEVGRRSGSGGFMRLAEMPVRLGGGTNLFDLFAPQSRTKRLFHVLTAGFGARRRASSVLRILWASLFNYVGWFVLGSAAGVILAAASVASGRIFLQVWGGVFGLLFAIAGGLVGVGGCMIRDLFSAVPANLFGLSTGLGTPSSGHGPALTAWLTRELNVLAGKDPAEPPLTFAELWGIRSGAAVAEKPEDPAINLEMITTNLTQGRPYRLPLEQRVWFFDSEQMRRLFPEEVVQWMEQHPGPCPDGMDPLDWEWQCCILHPLHPLPSVADLPVVMATRMSVSFPILISAVPLWAVDWNVIANAHARDAWQKWLKVKENQADWVADDSPHKQITLERPDAPPRVKAGVNWFSDGGITSNFPVHFFDAPLPRWPTFAINLRAHREEYAKADNGHDERVWMPDTNLGGILSWWTPIDASSGRKGLGQFLWAIIDTAMNWMDNMQLAAPGYRDRVAHIELDAGEGGLNLQMPSDRIESLSRRGQRAGAMLGERFGSAPREGTKLTWDNHRWVRYRTLMALIEPMLERFTNTYSASPVWGTSYPDLVKMDPPPSYDWDNHTQHQLAQDATNELVGITNWWQKSTARVAHVAPRPRPELRVRPRI